MELYLTAIDTRGVLPIYIYNGGSFATFERLHSDVQHFEYLAKNNLLVFTPANEEQANARMNRESCLVSFSGAQGRLTEYNEKFAQLRDKS